ncbi:MAG: peptidylprolyl isomerase [Candidatus Micrarchaeota archaeon]
MKKLLLVVFLLFVFGCTSMTPDASTNASAKTQANAADGSVAMTKNIVEKGDMVSVDYVGTLSDGTVFDTSLRDVAQNAGLELRPSYQPLSFSVGAGQMIPGFDNGVVGMKEGEEKTIFINAKDAYGESTPDNIVQVPVDAIDGTPTVGQILQANNGAMGVVTSVTSDRITVDFNHPLAGKDLTFKVTVRSIKKK